MQTFYNTEMRYLLSEVRICTHSSSCLSINLSNEDFFLDCSLVYPKISILQYE